MGDGKKYAAERDDDCARGDHDIQSDGRCSWCKKEVKDAVKLPFNPRSLMDLAVHDAEVVTKKNKEYGESWCKRGGHQAFAVIWRKADRIEAIMEQMDNGFDIFDAWDKNPGNIRDDIRDLRSYLLLLEEYMIRPMVKKEKEMQAAMQKLIDSGEPQGRGYVDQD